ncbi:hypothetical protein LOZ80_38065 [Paenibacillus sp. HWE-109]|uniref:hypothetical protein n=1 Tax=Paenibacillus sp. HWE-109 TaxID=1306526 RepID=UPI001EDE0550|nr:hypothetical protein [Paenibacillus sp. HWE-109]UKS27199.1 hypothetical protein LOZ80_38065 [Paenibacillus sp. HWE-109]
MFKINTPRFNLDGAASGGDTSSSWMDVAKSSIAEPVDDGQPGTDPDTEGLEPADILTDAENVVEPNSDDQAQDDKPADTTPTLDDESEIDLGEGRQPVKLAELKSGYLRQSDYTKKTQALATERQTFETERATWEPAKQTDEFLKSNPWLASQINGFIQEFKSTGAISLEQAMEDVQYGQYINALVGDVTRLTREVETLRGENEGIKLTSEMTGLQNELKAEYGELVTDDYIKTLQDRGKAEKLSTATLREIADGYLTKQQMKGNKQNVTKATKEAEAKTIQSIQEKRTALPPQPRSNGQRPAEQQNDISNMSWFDIAKSSMS